MDQKNEDCLNTVKTSKLLDEMARNVRAEAMRIEKGAPWIAAAGYRQAGVFGQTDIEALGADRSSVAKNYRKERTMHVQTAIIVNETHLPESVHEVTDSRPGGTDHFRQRLLTHLWENSLGL